jgi:hypothetical protein
VEVGDQPYAAAALSACKRPPGPLDRRVGGLQSQSEHVGKKNSCPCQELNSVCLTCRFCQNVGRPGRHEVVHGKVISSVLGIL